MVLISLHLKNKLETVENEKYKPPVHPLNLSTETSLEDNRRNDYSYPQSL